MSRLAVSKMHGTLNDFIVIDLRNQSLGADPFSFARRWCHRRAGLGADGVLLIESSQTAHARMRIINSDGTEAEMCGNGVRCVARYLYEHGEGDALTIETLGGPIETKVISNDPFLVRVNMGTPVFEASGGPFAEAHYISMGNPHAVLFVDSAADVDLHALGKRAPDLNVHVASAVDRTTLFVRHHERGAGLTQACGTGAVASAAAAMRTMMVRSPVTVRVPGGDLTVEWDGTGDAFMTGPAVRVFDATLDS